MTVDGIGLGAREALLLVEDSLERRMSQQVRAVGRQVFPDGFRTTLRLEDFDIHPMDARDLRRRRDAGVTGPERFHRRHGDVQEVLRLPIRRRREPVPHGAGTLTSIGDGRIAERHSARLVLPDEDAVL